MLYIYLIVNFIVCLFPLRSKLLKGQGSLPLCFIHVSHVFNTVPGT